jgi:hypothetical protein
MWMGRLSGRGLFGERMGKGLDVDVDGEG